MLLARLEDSGRGSELKRDNGLRHRKSSRLAMLKFYESKSVVFRRKQSEESMVRPQSRAHPPLETIISVKVTLAPVLTQVLLAFFPRRGKSQAECRSLSTIQGSRGSTAARSSDSG
jgi:hypothetical protein